MSENCIITTSVLSFVFIFKILLVLLSFRSKPYCNFSKKKCSVRVAGNQLRMWVIVIDEDPTLTVKCRPTIKALCLYFVSKCNDG
jgi:hypothetical protein